MTTITTPNGKTYGLMARQAIDGLAFLQAKEPNTVAFLFVSDKGRALLVRELKDGSLTNAVAL